MLTVLSVFTSTAFKEIRLPNVVNTDYSFILYKNIFHISEDLEIQLENINGSWSFLENSKYDVMKDTEKYIGKPMKDQDIFHVFTEQSENITIIVYNVNYSISVFNKYAVENVSEITIGKNEEMDICYDYEGMVSRFHARIYKGNSGEWRIENKSVNGIYVNSVLLQTDMPLNFGDVISFMGLHIMMLGEMIAIDQANHQMKINCEKLKLIKYEKKEKKKDVEADKQKKKGMVLLRRSPRNIEKIETERIEIERPPEVPKSKQQPLIMTIVSVLYNGTSYDARKFINDLLFKGIRWRNRNLYVFRTDNVGWFCSYRCNLGNS